MLGKTIPLVISRHWSICFQSTKSGAGEQFLLLGCGARASRKGCFSQTPVSTARAHLTCDFHWHATSALNNYTWTLFVELNCTCCLSCKDFSQHLPVMVLYIISNIALVLSLQCYPAYLVLWRTRGCAQAVDSLPCWETRGFTAVS